MRSVPPKLNLPMLVVKRDVFACTTLSDFERLYQALTSAPNFEEIDYASSHNSFSAGLKCYKRYLEHLTREGNDKTEKEGEVADVMEIVLSDKDAPSANAQVVDFSDLSVYTGTRPDKCVVELLFDHLKSFLVELHGFQTVLFATCLPYA